MVVTLKFVVVWSVTPYSLWNVYQRLRRMCCLPNYTASPSRRHCL